MGHYEREGLWWLAHRPIVDALESAPSPGSERAAEYLDPTGVSIVVAHLREQQGEAVARTGKRLARLHASYTATIGSVGICRRSGTKTSLRSAGHRPHPHSCGPVKSLEAAHHQPRDLTLRCDACETERVGAVSNYFKVLIHHSPHKAQSSVDELRGRCSGFRKLHPTAVQKLRQSHRRETDEVSGMQAFSQGVGLLLRPTSSVAARAGARTFHWECRR